MPDGQWLTGMLADGHKFCKAEGVGVVVRVSDCHDGKERQIEMYCYQDDGEVE